MEFISYAQNFEDVMLWRALGHIQKGTYIDLGAHDPLIDSVSMVFYERGWRGIHVDAARSCIEKLRASRPDEIVLHAAISDFDGFADFFSFQKNGQELGISCCVAAQSEIYKSKGWTQSHDTVPCITLDGLFQGLSASDVHWLKIDIEGHEAKAFQGWRHSTLRPWLIVVESTHPLSTETTHTEWEPLVLAKGYEFVYFDGLNRFYISAQHPELKFAFDHPPCVFDEFVLHGGASHAMPRRLLQQLNEARQLQTQTTHQNEKLRAQAEALERTVSHAHSRLVSFEDETAKLSKEIEDLRLMHSRGLSIQLATISGELATEVERRRQVEFKLAAQIQEIESVRSNHAAESDQHSKIISVLLEAEGRLRTTLEMASAEHKRELRIKDESHTAELHHQAQAFAHVLQKEKEQSRDELRARQAAEQAYSKARQELTDLRGSYVSKLKDAEELCDQQSSNRIQLHKTIENMRVERAMEIETLRTRYASEISNRDSNLLRQVGEVERLTSLVYAAAFGQHIYRALRVLLEDPHYCRHARTARKTYNPHAAWHTHLYRSIRAPFTAGDRPWHTHLYRAWRALRGDLRYRRVAQPTTITKLIASPPQSALLSPPPRDSLPDSQLELIIRPPEIDPLLLKAAIHARLNKSSGIL